MFSCGPWLSPRRAVNQRRPSGSGDGVGEAKAGSDYVAASGTLTFAANERSKTVEVEVLADEVDEGSETMTLTLSNPSGARIADGEAIGTIENSGHIPQAWIARFGRTVADQVLDAVDARLRAARTAGASVTGSRCMVCPRMYASISQDIS